MLYPTDTDLATALGESHSPSWRVSAYYGPDLTIADIPVSVDGGLDFDGDQEVQGSGTLYVRRDAGGVEDSLVPKVRTDPLAPYGQEVAIDRVISWQGREWVVPMGRFAITDVPTMQEFRRQFIDKAGKPGSFVLGYALQAKLRDRFDLIRESEFLYPTQPQVGATAWSEMQRISPFPIVQSLADVTLPADLVYSESRMAAITTLASALGGIPHLTRQGALTVRRRDRWLTDTVPDFTVPAVIQLDDGMSNALRNAAVVTSTKDATILAVATINDPKDPLYVNGPFGTRVARLADPLIDTQAKADAAAATMLKRISTQQSRVATVTMLPDPRIEVGDFGAFVDIEGGRTLTGEVRTLHYSMDPLAEMTLDVVVADLR